MHFADRLADAVRRKRTPAVVGLDPVFERLPLELRAAARSAAETAGAVERFCRAVIEVVAPLVPAVKINVAFFEPLRAAGIAAFFRLIEAARAAGLLVIADIKRGDIGSTAEHYARAFLEQPAYEDLSAAGLPDAVTVAGYLGRGAVQPFIDLARRSGRGLYVLVRPSDPGADELHEFGQPRPFYEHLAERVRFWGRAAELRGACGLSCVGAVVAPRDPESTRRLRQFMPHTPFLVPGYGAQGADAAACRACFLATPGSAVVNASRSVIYAFESPQYSGSGGWQAAVERACRFFAADVAACLPTA